MEEQREKLITEKLSLRYMSGKDFLGLLIFLAIPLSFFVSNVIGTYRLYYYLILLVFIIVYALIGQFFFEEQRFGNIGKRLIALTIINTLLVSFVHFTGNVSSPYFFILYFLIFSIAIVFPIEILMLENVIIFLCIFVAEWYDFGSFSVLFSSISSIEKALLFSIPISLPLVIGISLFVNRLTIRQKLLETSRNLLAIQDIEGEALLSEINQGIIMLDPNLRIVKISHWIEQNLNTTARILLGKKIDELTFIDAVTNEPFRENHPFYKNLFEKQPQRLNWRILYKNQYGKYIKLVVKQRPLIVNDRVIGFLLLMRYPPKALTEVMTTFNQLFNFRLSSSLAIVKNFLETSQSIRADVKYPQIQGQISLITRLLNDSSIKGDIADGNIELTISRVDIQAIINNIITGYASIGSITLWNVSPSYKNKPIVVETDTHWCQKLLAYAIQGALFLAKDRKVAVNIDEDEILRKPTILITSDAATHLPERIDLLEPFFSGKLLVLSKYAGTGLEISNANLLAKFLGFDFNAEIGNNKVVIKIIF